MSWLFLSLLLLCDLPVSAEPLRHRFFILRHGNSLANVGGIISSDPALATVEHGLSDQGWVEAEAAAAAVVRAAVASGCGVAICSSDFKRTHQTALMVRAGVVAAGLRVWPEGGVLKALGLRERYFGGFDGEGDDSYRKIWAEDAISADHEAFGVESVSSVLERAFGVVEQLNSEPALASGSQRWLIVLVAHGDVLQILQTRFAKIEPRRHRELEHLPTATLRELC